MIDYYEQRIAELEALCERRAETISRREQAQIQMREERDTLRAELARVKAESLRDTEPNNTKDDKQ